MEDKVEVLEEKSKKEEFEEVKFQEVKVNNEPKEVRTDSYFDGKVLDYIGWKLLANIITCVTLGIAAPWAKCMLYRYQFSHTIYNGKRLKFEGEGGDLFVKRFIWYFLTCITFGIYGWWVPAKKANWVISNLHFEDEEYKEGESFFEEQGIKLFWLNVLCNFLNIITVGLMIPFTMCIKLKYINKHAVINKKKLVFTGAGINLLGRYILWGFLTCITLGIYGWWVPVNMFRWQTSNIHIKKVGEVEEKNNDKSIFLIIPLFIAGAIALFGILILFFRAFSGFSLEGIFQYPIDDTINGWKYCEKGYAYGEAGYGRPYCYKTILNIDSTSCYNRDGTWLQNQGCYITAEPKKKPNNGYDSSRWETETKAIIEEEYGVQSPTEEEPTSSQCKDGWYYVEYIGKCAKDLEHVSYEDCEARGGSFAGFDSCTIYE